MHAYGRRKNLVGTQSLRFCPVHGRKFTIRNCNTRVIQIRKYRIYIFIHMYTYTQYICNLRTYDQLRVDRRNRIYIIFIYIYIFSNVESSRIQFFKIYIFWKNSHISIKSGFDSNFFCRQFFLTSM